MNKVVPISLARSNLPTLVDQASSLSHTTMISVKGKVEAALVNAEDYESMKETIEVLSDPKTMKAIAQSEKEIKEGKVFSLDEVKKELGL